LKGPLKEHAFKETPTAIVMCKAS